MQMTDICVCLAYADAWHMDMLYLFCFLISPPQIRKILFSDLLRGEEGLLQDKHKKQ